MFGWLVKAGGRALQKKFIDLGTLKGKTRSEIEEVVGPANSISGVANGMFLYQWLVTGYHIALFFDADDICQGVHHEFAS